MNSIPKTASLTSSRALTQSRRDGRIRPKQLSRLHTADASASEKSSTDDPASTETRDEPAPPLGRLVKAVKRAENGMNYAVVTVLMGVVVATLYDTTRTLAETGASLPTATTAVLDGVLFAVIIFEITTTILTHFNTQGLQLELFLTIGIVSAVREVLVVGARLSLDNIGAANEVHVALLELGINAAVVVGLATSLVLIRRYVPSGLNEAETARGELC